MVAYADGVERHINSGSFDEKHISNMIDTLIDKIEGVSTNYQDTSINKTSIEYGFIDTPSGGCYVEDEKLNDILSRKSVMPVRNSDNNCFWYCMLYLQSDDANVKRWDTRPKNKNNAQQICESCNLKWDEKVSMDQIPIIEEALKTNIYILNIRDLPMFSKDMHLYNSLMYMNNDQVYDQQYWLLYDDVHEHFHVITNIKNFFRLSIFVINVLEHSN